MKNIIAKVFALIAICLFSLPLSAQKQKIDELGLSFRLPNKKWEFADKRNSGAVTAYIFKRQPVRDEDGQLIIPNIAFLIEEVSDSMDVIQFSLIKRMSVSFDIDEVLSHVSEDPVFSLKNAIGYKGSYTDENGLLHRVYILHVIYNGYGGQIIMDMTDSVFLEYEDEFLKCLGSLKVKR